MHFLYSSGRALSLYLLACFLLLVIPATGQQNGKKALLQAGPRVAAGNPMQIKPSGEAPDWAPDIDPQMLAVIEQLKSYEAPPFTDLSAFQVRNAKLPAEAVADLLKKAGMPATEPKVDISHRLLPVGSDQGTLVRIYTPLDAGSAPLPVIVYYHGGGWVIADLETYEAGAAALAEQVGAVVVSVAYRQAPEEVFPTAHEDAFAAYQWVVENTDSIGGDPERIATAGESAGGNLAVAVALMAKERDVPLPVHILSVYPIADGDVESPSYEKYANALPLSKGFMAWFFDYYYPDWQDSDNPWINLTSADLSGLPGTTIINAQIDPLEAEGGELEQQLKKAGIDVERRLYEGVTHEFFGMAAILEQAKDAQAFAAERLKAALISK
ncbi:alpha/beta hydrolase [Lewinella sp. IMCC34191]|uniref:alpha/beta hydrolase n=1 Tax=Lewinella sp. IMCC34191 TaxID=2259172 RepID=UPI000E26C68A|nr:alpha/beta hydrolase [Lewinella sp. IMCC34191]